MTLEVLLWLDDLWWLVLQFLLLRELGVHAFSKADPLVLEDSGVFNR